MPVIHVTLTGNQTDHVMLLLMVTMCQRVMGIFIKVLQRLHKEHISNSVPPGDVQSIVYFYVYINYVCYLYLPYLLVFTIFMFFVFTWLNSASLILVSLE